MHGIKGGKRRKARDSGDRSQILRLEITDRLGNARWITADVFDFSTDGAGIVAAVPVPLGTTVKVRGKITGGHDVRAKVAWCLRDEQGGGFRVGLEFSLPTPEPASEPESQKPEEQPAREADPGELDFYEIMQLSPNADTETIHRVYRILAQRYHPDNSETGNKEMFLQLSEAYRELSDPERRAAYDTAHRRTRQLQWRIFDQTHTTTGVEGEKRKRAGILGLLYSIMVHDPEHAEMTIHQFETLLGCPREHLLASIWYLKGKGYIQRTDNGKYYITVDGFDFAEVHSLRPAQSSRLLPEPAVAE